MAECDKRNLLRDYRLVAATDASALQAVSVSIFFKRHKTRTYAIIYHISLLQVSACISVIKVSINPSHSRMKLAAFPYNSLKNKY